MVMGNVLSGGGTALERWAGRPLYNGSNKAFSKAKMAVEQSLRAAGLPSVDIMRTLGRIAYGAGATGDYGAIELDAGEIAALQAAMPLLPPDLQQATQRFLTGGGAGMLPTNPALAFYGDALPGILSGDITGPLQRNAEGAIQQATPKRYQWRPDGTLYDSLWGHSISMDQVTQDMLAEAGPPPTTAAGAAAVSSGLPTNPVLAGAGAAPAAGAGAGSDAYAAFKAAYDASPQRGAFGELTQDMLNQGAFLVQLPNELLRLLPAGRLVGLPTSRLAQFSNEDLIPLIRSNPNLLTGFSMDRLVQFGRDFLTNEALPHFDRQNPDLATQLRHAMATTPAGPGTAPPPTTTPSGGGPPAGPGSTSTTTPTLPPNPLIQALPGREGLAAGQWNDFSDLTPNTLKYMFPWMEEPEFAAENVLQSGLGISPRSGNPMGQFFLNQIIPQAQLLGDARTLAGQDAGNAALLTGLGDFFESGGANTGVGPNFKTGMNDLINSYTQGDLVQRANAEKARIHAENPALAAELTTAEAALKANPNDAAAQAAVKAALAKLQPEYDKSSTIRQHALAISATDPRRAFELHTQVGGDSMNPFFRYNPRLMNAVFGNLRSSWLRDSANRPNDSFFGYLMPR